jgi:hypothetical protein
LGVNDVMVGVDHAYIGFGFEKGDGGSGGEEIVAVDPAKVLSLGLLMGGSEGGVTALVFGGEVADAGVLGGVVGGDFS